MIGKPLKEEWRPIEKTNNTYFISNLGRVKSVDRVTHCPDGRMRRFPGKLLAPMETLNGYLYVYIGSPMNKNKLVHRLVAQAFAKNDSGGNYINHINGNKKDNVYTNLEWCFQKDNVRHAIKTGLMEYTTPSKPIIAYKGGNVVGTFPSISDCARKLNCNDGCISNVLHGRRKTHHGFTFKLVNSDDLDGGWVGDNAVKVVAIKGAQTIKAKSYSELAKKLGVMHTSVSDALKYGTKIKGFTVRKDE